VKNYALLIAFSPPLPELSGWKWFFKKYSSPTISVKFHSSHSLNFNSRSCVCVSIPFSRLRESLAVGQVLGASQGFGGTRDNFGINLREQGISLLSKGTLTIFF